MTFYTHQLTTALARRPANHLLYPFHRHVHTVLSARRLCLSDPLCPSRPWSFYVQHVIRCVQSSKITKPVHQSLTLLVVGDLDREKLTSCRRPSSEFQSTTILAIILPERLQWFRLLHSSHDLWSKPWWVIRENRSDSRIRRKCHTG